MPGSMRGGTFILVVGSLGVIIPLAAIFLSVIVSPWFSFWDNALSDLGHAVKSYAAPVFNFGLAAGGFLIGLVSYSYLLPSDKGRGLILLATGFFLMLVGVFDEVYGRLHFVVSVLFFLSLMTYLVYTGIRMHSILRLAVFLLHIIIWYLHFVHDLPPGAALPELATVFSFTPFYLYDLLWLQGVRSVG